MTETPCYCQSGLSFNQCCQPYLTGSTIPPTPQSLMRSRYSAYVQQNAAYLLDTWHIANASQRDNLLASIEDSFQHTLWQGLNVLASHEDPINGQGFVEFMAYFTDTLTQQSHVIYERSRFIFSNQRWYYIDGIKPKIERNDSCPCGSGKKYKKCCY